MVGRKQKKPKKTSQSAAQPTSAAAKKRRKEPWVLAIDSGIHAGDRLQLVDDVHIGRSESCELVLDDDYVSSMHAQLHHRQSGGWVLQDLGSTNGTHVNGQKIAEPRVVGVNDIIRIGGVQMRLEI